MAVYDAVLVLSFGGPDKPADVVPFLENVLRGRNVPRARLEEVADRYGRFGGRSPQNAHNRALVAALARLLASAGPPLPVYWGNRNWHPLLADTLRQMASDGVRRALAFATSAFGSYSGCRQYQEDIARARQAVGPTAPEVDKLRLFYNHPDFIGPFAEQVASCIAQIPAERRAAARLVFTAHSIPVAMAAGSPYEQQLHEACRLIYKQLEATAESPQSPQAAESATIRRESRAGWDLVYQSRSGPPEQPWLEPDVMAHLERLGLQGGLRDVVVAPIGFLSENIEVIYDLDIAARSVCDRFAMTMVRCGLPGAEPLAALVRQLVLERVDERRPRLALGQYGAAADVCRSDCCRPPARGS